MIGAAGVLIWALGTGRKGARNGASVVLVVGLALSTLEATAPPVSGDTVAGPPARHGLSSNRVERECLDRVANQLVSPGSMRFLGNPVNADPYWDSAENEWRWIVDVSGVNAFNVRVRGRFQCIVRAGPTWTVRQVN